MSCKTSYVAAKYVVDKWITLFWPCCKKKRCSDYSQLEYTVNKVLITGALTKNTTSMGTGQDGKKLVQGWVGMDHKLYGDEWRWM